MTPPAPSSGYGPCTIEKWTDHSNVDGMGFVVRIRQLWSENDPMLTRLVSPNRLRKLFVADDARSDDAARVPLRL